jgi:tyrosinase
VTTVELDLELPPGGADSFTRADLTFYGIEHGGPSFRVHVFFDAPGATVETPRSLEAGYVGSFSVFGHGDCFGDEGHCDVRGAVTAFDRRPPHQLVPTTRVLVVTEAVRVRAAAGGRSLHVTAVGEMRPSALVDAETAESVLVMDQVALHTYY